jgi:hypothetical protein
MIATMQVDKALAKLDFSKLLSSPAMPITQARFLHISSPISSIALELVLTEVVPWVQCKGQDYGRAYGIDGCSPSTKIVSDFLKVSMHVS